MASFGETLKRERELREISLRDIADATKINIRYLEALEQNRFEILPGGLFNKGFIRAYARFIGANGEALVDGYLQEIASREAAAAGAAPTPSQPGLHRPAEMPLRRSTDAPPARGDASAPVAGPAISVTEPRSGAGGAAAIAIVGTDVAAPSSLTSQTPTTTASRRLMPVMTIVGAAAVLLILVVGARGFRDNSPRPTPPAGIPAVLAEPAALQEAAASLPVPSGAVDTAPIIEDAPAAAAVPQGSAPERPRRSVNPPAPTLERAPAPETQPAPPVTAPPAPARQPAPIQEPPPASGMEFRVEAASAVWVQVACDGEDRMNRSLQAGEGQTLRCLSLIRISATDAGAVRLFVNGVRCVPIGDPGTRVEGFAIRSEDYRAICPPGGAASDGRR
jgi:cytoskeletal protein RodZ